MESQIPTEVTVELPSGSRSETLVELVPPSEFRATSSGLNSETQGLLHTRLLAAALAFLLVSTVMLILEIASNPWEWTPFRGVRTSLVFLDFALVLWLSRNDEFSIAMLRRIELLLFGAIAAATAQGYYIRILEHAVSQNHVMTLASVKTTVASLCILLMAYGMFIPNTWKRAARVMSGFVVIMVATIVTLFVTHVEVKRYVRQIIQPEQIAEHLVFLGAAFGMATYGTHVINSLRREVFEAKRLGQYHLVRLIGTGGMGEVYLAEHRLLKRPAAIKLIRPGKAADPVAIERFEREVKSTAKLSHWNTVEIFDYGLTEDGTFYYVMEYLPGLNLADLVRRHGPLPPERVILYMRQACDALSEAHGMGLVHRDIKPENIFAARRGGRFDVTKLLDFGLVRPSVDAEPGSREREDESIAGSPPYMAPEQARFRAVPDPRTDLYALGCVGYFLLTGRPPFLADNLVLLLRAHALEEVRPPSELVDGLPNDLEAIVLRCLAKQPEDRFENAREMGRALSACRAAELWTEDRSTLWWIEHEPRIAIRSEDDEFPERKPPAS